MVTVGITGGTGFVGSHLTALLLAGGYKIVIFTRHPEKHAKHHNIEYSYWDPARNKCDHSAIKKLNAVVHLAGTSLNTRWTTKVKRDIVASRVNGTHFLVSQLKNEASLCKTFIAASAIGYYGDDDGRGKAFTETDPPANDFLADTCVQWEQESLALANSIRTVVLRFGIVMGKDGGAYPQLAQPLSFGIMPLLGGGKQIMSWIHVDDLANLLLYGITNTEMSGIYNAVSPSAVSQKELMQNIASTKRGVRIPVNVPPAVLKIALGEMSTEILKSCTVSADKTISAGFTYKYPAIQDAVNAIAAK